MRFYGLASMLPLQCLLALFPTLFASRLRSILYAVAAPRLCVVLFPLLVVGVLLAIPGGPVGSLLWSPACSPGLVLMLSVCSAIIFPSGRAPLLAVPSDRLRGPPSQVLPWSPSTGGAAHVQSCLALAKLASFRPAGWWVVSYLARLRPT